MREERRSNFPAPALPLPPRRRLSQVDLSDESSFWRFLGWLLLFLEKLEFSQAMSLKMKVGQTPAAGLQEI